MKEDIFLYYTNDLHSYFSNWPYVMTYFKTKKKERMERDHAHFFIDIGDHVDRTHPITEATMGKGNVKLLNEAQYDVVTIGNNEGITLSHEDLYHLYDDAMFDVVCSNLNSVIEENPPWLKHHTILETKTGVKIGFLGITAAFNPYYNLLGWHVDSYNDVLVDQLPKLRRQVDIVVLLSHVGINEDQLIAQKYPDIDVIIGGHTHHLFRTGEYVNDVLITAAGKHCSYVGEVILTWDHQQETLVQKEAYTTQVTYLQPDLETKRMIQSIEQKAEKQLAKPIVHLKESLQVDWFKETMLMKRLTEMAHEVTDADCAMLNAGLLIESLPEGDITLADVHRICPHPINLCVVSIKGYELLEVIRASLTSDFMNLPLRGFGFRGKLLGRMVFSGLDVKTKLIEEQEYVEDVLYKGKPLQKDKTYTLVTADTFTFGRILPEIAKSEYKKLYLPDFIRDLLSQTLIKHFSTKS